MFALKIVNAFNPGAVIVSLGVDTYINDPISGFKIHESRFIEIGEILKNNKCPTMFVYEGGYYAQSVGRLVVNILKTFN